MTEELGLVEMTGAMLGRDNRKALKRCSGSTKWNPTVSKVENTGIVFPLDQELNRQQQSHCYENTIAHGI